MAIQLAAIPLLGKALAAQIIKLLLVLVQVLVKVKLLQ